MRVSHFKNMLYIDDQKSSKNNSNKLLPIISTFSCITPITSISPQMFVHRFAEFLVLSSDVNPYLHYIFTHILLANWAQVHITFLFILLMLRRSLWRILMAWRLSEMMLMGIVEIVATAVHESIEESGQIRVVNISLCLRVGGFGLVCWFHLIIITKTDAIVL